MPNYSRLKRVLTGAAIGGVPGAGLGAWRGYAIPGAGKTKEEKKKSKLRRALIGAGLGGSIGAVLGAGAGDAYHAGVREAEKTKKFWDDAFKARAENERRSREWGEAYRNARKTTDGSHRKSPWEDFWNDYAKHQQDWANQSRRSSGGGRRTYQGVGHAAKSQKVENFASKVGLPKQPKTKEELKKAYRAAALKYHPDKAPSANRAEYEEIMKDINEYNDYWKTKVAKLLGFFNEMEKIGNCVR